MFMRLKVGLGGLRRCLREIRGPEKMFMGHKVGLGGLKGVF